MEDILANTVCHFLPALSLNAEVTVTGNCFKSQGKRALFSCYMSWP